MDYARELEVASLAAREAGALILEHYARGSIAVETKADASPVTAADRDANAAIVARLGAAFPEDGVLSEETPDNPSARLHKRRVWIVDPLDGTRDFVARSGEFCVHVGLAVDGVPVVGAVYQPVTATLYTGVAGGDAFAEVDGRSQRLQVSTVAAVADLRTGVSRTNASDLLRRCLTETGLDKRAVAMGASVKLMALARGDLDVVINFSAGEQEWDTCAPEAVVRAAGGLVTDARGHTFSYNQANVAHRSGSVASNAACHTLVLDLLRPYTTFDEAHPR